MYIIIQSPAHRFKLCFWSPDHEHCSWTGVIHTVRRRRWWDAGIPFWLVHLQSLSFIVEEFWSRSGKEDIVLMNTSIIHDINKVQPINSTECKQNCHVSIRVALALPIRPQCFTETLEFWEHRKLDRIHSHKHTYQNVHLFIYLYIYIYIYLIASSPLFMPWSKGSDIVHIFQII